MICSSQFLFYTFSSFHSLDVISDAIMLIYRVHLMGSFFDSLPFSFYVLWSQGDINEIFSSGLYWSWKMNLFLFTRPSFDIIYNGYNVYHKKKKEVMKVIIFCGSTKKISLFLLRDRNFPFSISAIYFNSISPFGTKFKVLRKALFYI